MFGKTPWFEPHDSTDVCPAFRQRSTGGCNRLPRVHLIQIVLSDAVEEPNVIEREFIGIGKEAITRGRVLSSLRKANFRVREDGQLRVEWYSEGELEAEINLVANAGRDVALFERALHQLKEANADAAIAS